MTLNTNVVRAESHPEAGAVIARDAALLVERWCRRAIDEQPAAKRVHYDVLRDHLPAFLQAVARALTMHGAPDPKVQARAPEIHGSERWESGWSPSEVVRDYQILQLVVLEHLEASLGRPLECREVMAVGVHFDDAIAASIRTYVQSRDDDLRRGDRERADALALANRNKDQFLASLAHELRNPLAPMLNSVREMRLLTADANPAVLEAALVVERQVGQLSRLVDDLLDLARITQGRFEVRKEPLDLRSVLGEAVQMTEPLIRSNAHQLSVVLPERPLLVDADPSRLLQVVVNLLHNAAKYTPRGGEISMTTEAAGGHASIRVRDNGIGIAPDVLPTVFEMFVQAPEAQRHAQGGLGVGLALARRLVELHAGTITCASEGPGRGSEFVVRLPLRTAPTPPRPVAPATPAVAPRHVLIVEDQADARESLARLLTLMGHRVDVADSGGQGIERALAVGPDAVLVDIGLPDISGYEVAAKLRSARGSDLTLIALTGFGQDEDLTRARAAGFDAHLIKPASLEDVQRLLARSVGGTGPVA